ncbi:MAG: CDP-alcohol phosphatidyltransferase family protein [Verrucomicrobiae bacterium]|nr:CDP-alcohol phosphatidyltransferase family protein [Verrucomicrobiae bacterium]
MSDSTAARRPLKTRNAKWAGALAKWLAKTGLTPNQISVGSIFFALVAAVAFVYANQVSKIPAGWLFLAGAAGIQLRLLCNMLDGMVAVEGGLRTKTGELYNEIPDRFADALILIGAGYSSGDAMQCVLAGWLAALLAVITAYVRALGVAAGAAQCFYGPMAKPHRMALLTAASIVGAICVWLECHVKIIPIALWLMIAGCLVTIYRRIRQIAAELKAKG